MTLKEVEMMIEEITGDSSSGALEILLKAFSIIEFLCEGYREGTMGKHDVLLMMEYLESSKKEMVSIENLVNRFMDLSHRFDPGKIDEALRETEQLVGLEEASPDYAFDQIKSLFEGKKVDLLTYSYSSSVVRVISRLATLAKVRLVTSEGRPTADGERLLNALAGKVAEMVILTDAALLSSVGDVDLAFLGCDGWSENFFVNKMGTKALAQLLDIHNKQAFVFASRFKKCTDDRILSIEFKDYGAEGIQAPSLEGIVRINRYFELIPLYPNITLFSPS